MNYALIRKNDIANGTLTREQMQELIELSFIKMDTLRKIRNYPETAIASGIGVAISQRGPATSR